MNISVYQLKVTFLTPVLGTQPQKDVASEYLGEKVGVRADELETLPELLEKGTTVFHRLPDTHEPLYYDFHVLGLLKEAGQAFNGKEGLPKNLRSKVATYAFVRPRRIMLRLPDGAPLNGEYEERPLRAQTQQGPRTALARSEKLPEGTSFTCEVGLLPSDVTEKVLRELLDYGIVKGFGQWRGGGWGRFTYELTPDGEMPLSEWGKALVAV